MLVFQLLGSNMQLKEQQKKFLRGLGHDLHPIVMIASKGLSDNINKEINIGLNFHELIKVKVTAETRELRDELIKTICSEHNCELIQRVGHIALLYRRNHKEPKITIPK